MLYGPGSTQYIDPLHDPLRLSKGEKTGTVRESIVVAGRSAGVSALVEQLQVARVDGHCLVWVGSDNVTVTDVVGPRGTAVGLAGEGSAFRASLDGPRAIEAARGERAEVSTVVALSLDNHEVLVLTGDLVHLNGLENLLRSVAEDDLGCGAEASREIADGHLGVVDLAVVTGKEEMHAGAVTDERLVDGTGVGVRDVTVEELLRRGPAIGVGGVAARPVGELADAPLRSEDPDRLGSEVEEGGCHRSAAHTGLSGRGHVGPAREGGEAHRAVLAVAVVGSINQMLSVVRNVGEVLEVGPAVGRRSEGSRRGPSVGRRQRTGPLLSLRCGVSHRGNQACKGDEGGGELHVGNEGEGRLRAKKEVPWVRGLGVRGRSDATPSCGSIYAF